MTTHTTEITSAAIGRTIAAHTPCCMYNVPGLEAAVIAILRAHGYPVTDSVDPAAFTDEERADLADRLEDAAKAVRNPANT